MAEHEGSWHGSPPGHRQIGNRSHKESTGSRRSLFRGKKGKRLSETPMINVDEYEGDANERRSSILRKSKRFNSQAEDAGPSLISRISSPFDFQHLSHTDRHQIAALEKQLPDTPTDSLHFRNFSSENLATGEDRSSSALGFRSPPRSPEARHESENAPHFPMSRRPLRLARSIESFSQPGVSPRKHTHTSSSVQAPLQSPHLPLGPPFGTPELAYEESGSIPRRSSRSKRESGIWDSFALSAVSTPDIIPEILEDSSYFGHAVTTPDDSAIHATTPPSFSPSLADVAEEPERFVSPRPAPQPPLKTPTSPRSPYFGSFSFQSPRSPVTSRAHGRGQSPASPRAAPSVSRPSSQMSDTLGSGSIPRRMSIRRPTHRRQSNTWRAIEESWEEDVDYIYDNALEADCDFEWDRASDDGVRCCETPSAEQANNDSSRITSADRERFASDNFRSSLLVPSTGSVPELVLASAISTSTMGTGLPPTPSGFFNANRFSGDTGFILSPSLLVPQEYKDNREVTYEDLLDEYAGSDRHFPMLDASQSATSSARSSRVRLSRRSSYDSSLMSSVQGSGLWSSPVRRSASSAGSVPELIPSRRSRKSLGYSLAGDQLSEQIAFLNQDKEDDDVTPPGRTLEGRTFFASDDEVPQDEEQSRSSIETELRASLDLARRGSQRTNHPTVEEELKSSLDLARQGSQRSARTSARQHKQALSDGAAKLLSVSVPNEDQSAKLRNRSATTAQARSPMLSLFPAPPRNTSTTSQM
ncbi:hypothetical protein CC77DRAFT_934432 [Alternaria alternata]|uniref:CRIB domain-containing protein n=1 Tax=Alternaria alternata TaxID=5599 RepID=A0A177DMH1_ALTAL|nr:hypothetical protein CC77DRAFT_934432 [Alternaria alternata]OAG21144.1 hypothetical protein CC77DRAFT_934432 [Alternaria alternata]RYN61492.1 hypothetical protein AA0118_g5859 [Alternaria tenuissima]